MWSSIELLVPATDGDGEPENSMVVAQGQRLARQIMALPALARQALSLLIRAMSPIDESNLAEVADTIRKGAVAAIHDARARGVPEASRRYS